ncbi:MAG: hypothetical protein ACE5JF_10190, partial [Anaerolineales bacterium]
MPRLEVLLMCHKLRFPLAVVSGLLLAAVLAGCASSSPTIGDRVVATYGSFDNLPLTADEALDVGWIDTGDCVPDMGRHFIKMAGEQPGPLVLMYSPGGNLIGIELESLSEQPAPPWEHLPGGHPGMEFEHWT